MQVFENFELDSDEQILAMGNKNQVYSVYITALFLLGSIFFFFIMYILPTNDIFYRVVDFIIILDGLILLFATKYFYDSYQNNQIYLTKKRIIIIQKDKIEEIPFSDVKSINNYFCDIYSLRLKSKRFFVFAYTNLEDFKNNFYELCPNFKKNRININFIIISVFIVLQIICSLLVQKDYFYKMKYLDMSKKNNQEIQVSNSQTYMQYMQKAIKAHWYPPKMEQNASVNTEFKIMPDGTIYDVKVVETSGNREFDNAALFSIKSASPLKRLPEDIRNEEGVKINFSFDYNARKEENN